nr:dol-P-Man:Man(6)GlcNAc(2)-PP-Dol alpha-1,2-mannosyltransferase [Tanacetum cinerariifolium]
MGAVVYVGSEWHYFPSSFFIPDYVGKVRWTDDGFWGILPLPFNSTIGGTSAAPPYFNSKNKAAPDQFVSASSEGLAECKASASNLRCIQVKDIVKEVEDHLKTYSSAGMDISERVKKEIMRKERVKKGLIAESFDWDEEFFSSEDEGTTRIRAFMKIAKDEPSIGKADTRSSQRVDITMKKQIPGNIVKALGGRCKRKEKISSKEVIFTKVESSSMSIPKITSDSESEFETQEPLPPLPKLIGVAPAANFIMPFIINMENLNEVKVNELRSDNRTEFKNHKLEEFYDKKGEAVNTACYTQNKSSIVERHGKTSYDVLRGRSSDISYFHVFGCHVHIHNHRDHLGKFDEKAGDGFFLGYSSVAKAFRVFNIKRQKMKETIHVTLSEDDEAISQSNTEGGAFNFNES